MTITLGGIDTESVTEVVPRRYVFQWVKVVASPTFTKAVTDKMLGGRL